MALLLRQALGSLLMASSSRQNLLASPARVVRPECSAESLGRFREGCQDLLDALLLVRGTGSRGHVIAALQNDVTQDAGRQQAPGLARSRGAGVTNGAGVVVAVSPSRGVDRRRAPAAVDRH